MGQEILICIKDYRSGIMTNKDGLPFKSGAEFHAERHAEEMVRQGNTVTVFAKKQLRRMADYERLDGYGLHRLWPLLRGISLIWLLLTRYRNADVMHIMGRPDFAAFAVPVAKWLGILVSLEVTIVGEVFAPAGEYSWRRKPVKALRQSMFKHCDMFIANSQEMADDLLQHGIANEKIILHPQGIDTTRFTPLEAEGKKALRRRLMLPEDAVLVLFCCRVVERKGIDLLLEAWQKCPGKPDSRLIIVGGGEAKWLKRIEAEKSSDATIHYVPEVPDPVPYYQACDIYVFPSRREGLPTSLMEAMSCGLAPVVTAIGGNVDLVDGEEAVGLRCQPENATDLAKQLERVLADAVLRERLGKAARQKMATSFERRNLVKKLTGYFQNHKMKGVLNHRGHGEH